MNLGRTFFIAALWFAAWIIGGAIINGQSGAFAGFMTAFILGFALPWIAPESLQKWMDEAPKDHSR